MAEDRSQADDPDPGDRDQHVGLVAMPGKYWERMGAIVDHDEGTSANSRLLTWKVATKRGQQRLRWRLHVYYSPAASRYSLEPGRLHTAASALQALGEHGWLDLLLLLLVVRYTWNDLPKSHQRLKDSPTARASSCWPSG